MIDKRYRGKYQYEVVCGTPSHTWSVVGRHGGMHLWIRGYLLDGTMTWSGGIEMHYRTPPQYMEHDAPSHDCCWLLQAPCWHDGSSLQATEEWIPRWLMDPHDHDGMLAALAAYAEERLKDLADRG